MRISGQWSRGDRSGLELMFEALWKSTHHDELPFVAEHRFDDKRRFRFDFAWPEEHVAVEVEGGVYAKGRHVRGSGYTKDCEKYNLATLRGWKVLRFTGEMIRKEPIICVGLVTTLLKGQSSDEQ